jgi:hypothetical protein
VASNSASRAQHCWTRCQLRFLRRRHFRGRHLVAAKILGQSLPLAIGGLPVFESRAWCLRCSPRPSCARARAGLPAPWHAPAASGRCSPAPRAVPARAWWWPRAARRRPDGAARAPRAVVGALRRPRWRRGGPPAAAGSRRCAPGRAAARARPPR